MYKGLGMAMALLSAMGGHGIVTRKPVLYVGISPMSNLIGWQRITIDRAVVAELTSMELDEARLMNDPAKIAVADRYHNQAKRMLAAAQLKLTEFA